MLILIVFRLRRNNLDALKRYTCGSWKLNYWPGVKKKGGINTRKTVADQIHISINCWFNILKNEILMTKLRISSLGNIFCCIEPTFYLQI